MIETLEIEKGDFLTVEFYLDEDYEERYNDGDADFYYIYPIEDVDIEDAIYATIKDANVPIFIETSARRWATITVEERELIDVIDYGDSCMGGEEYVFTDKLLLTKYEYETT